MAAPARRAVLGGFNGAAPVKERKTSSASWGPQGSPGFNGAAPVKERKTPRRLAIPTECSRLQWGRSGEGAEDVRSGLLPPGTGCFNGAAPVKERKTQQIEMTSTMSIRFNGAAPVKERKTPDEG